MMKLATAALGVLMTGIALVAVGVALLDVTIDREFVAGFIVIPIGAVLIAATLWSLITRYLADSE